MQDLQLASGISGKKVEVFLHQEQGKMYIIVTPIQNCTGISSSFSRAKRNKSLGIWKG